MNLILFLLLFTPPANWSTSSSFDEIQHTAIKNHKLILLNFSGSDWCVPCIAMRKSYFDDSTFAIATADKILLVNADFPRKQKNLPSQEFVKRNESLAERYNGKGIFPLTLLLDGDGKVLASWEGKPEKNVKDWTIDILAHYDNYTWPSQGNE